MRPDQPRKGIVTFYRVYPGATLAMRADRSALGTIPAAAHQYCEAICSASAFGWYIFPPVDIRLKWNGVDVFYDIDGDWQSLTSTHLPDFLEYWDAHCPSDLTGMAPPFLSNLFVPGVVQIWSGLLVSTAENWSILIRPCANVPHSKLYTCYEGIVETDKFKPLPLFTNIKLVATDIPIEISKFKPLFQVQPLLRQCYTESNLEFRGVEGLHLQSNGTNGMTEADWEGYRKTIRSADPSGDSHSVGQYAVGVRKRAKHRT